MLKKKRNKKIKIDDDTMRRHTLEMENINAKNMENAAHKIRGCSRCRTNAQFCGALERTSVGGRGRGVVGTREREVMIVCASEHHVR